MTHLLDVFKEPAFWASALAMAAPLVLGVLGALICARAGVLNLGIEGIFIAGALAAVIAAQHNVGPWGGVVAAAVVGASFGFLHGILAGAIGATHALAGIAVTLLAAGLAHAGVHRVLVAGAVAAPFAPIRLPDLSELPAAVVSLLQQAPWLPDASGLAAAVMTLSQQTPLTYLAFVLALLIAYVLNRTPLGLALRACGDNPMAVAAQGRSVHAQRLGAIVAGSVMMAVGGAAYMQAAGHVFAIDTVAGRGFLCLALAAAMGWRPGLAVAAVLPFGMIEAARPHLQQEFGDRVAPELLMMLPYVLAIVVLAMAGRRARRPAALDAPYARGRHAEQMY